MKRLIRCFLLVAMIMRALAENEKTESYSMDLVQRAEGGDAQAQYNLGMCFFNGDGTKINDIEAIKWLTKAGDGGLPRAQCELGLIYSSGEGVNKNLKKAFEWYMKAAEKGWPDAQTSVGAAYFSGEGIEQDYVKAVGWYTKAAEKGDPRAQTLLGACYAKGNGVPQNQNEAIKWLEKAAQQENEHAKYFLEYILGSKNDKKCNNSSPIGQSEDELVARYGIPKTKDEEQQALLFEKSGYEIKVVMRSKKAVLVCIEAGKNKKINEEEVERLLKENSTEQNWSKVQNTDKNTIYKTSSGELADYNKASGTLTIATIESLKEPINDQKKLYIKVPDVSINPLAVFTNTKYNAERGNPDAQVSLGFRYQDGLGVERDDVEAVKWFQKAADQGYSKGTAALAFCFMEGKGIAENKKEAFNLYLKAYQQGELASALALGSCYLNGKGVSKNESEAVKWFLKAADSNIPEISENAKQILEQIKRK